MCEYYLEHSGIKTVVRLSLDLIKQRTMKMDMAVDVYDVSELTAPYSDSKTNQ